MKRDVGRTVSPGNMTSPTSTADPAAAAPVHFSEDRLPLAAVLASGRLAKTYRVPPLAAAATCLARVASDYRQEPETALLHSGAGATAAVRLVCTPRDRLCLEDLVAAFAAQMRAGAETAGVETAGVEPADGPTFAHTPESPDIVRAVRPRSEHSTPLLVISDHRPQQPQPGTLTLALFDTGGVLLFDHQTNAAESVVRIAECPAVDGIQNRSRVALWSRD